MDGKNWVRPSILNTAFPGTNRVIDLGGGRDSTTVWLDLEDTNPARRFKAFPYASGAKVSLYFSPDGIHWSKQPHQIATLNDRTTFFWNPFRKVWVNNIRGEAVVPAGNVRQQAPVRARYYAESRDLISWNPPDPRTTFWLAADENDPPYLGPGTQPPQLYSMDAVAYESLMLGLISFLHAGPEEEPGYLAGPNLVELSVGFSRDGFQWVRPTRGSGPLAFIPASNSPTAWDGYNTQSAGGCVLVVGDELWFYFSGRSLPHYQPWAITPMSTGLAMLRRDGFYSMDAGSSEGTLTTRSLRFSGSRFFVNVDNPAGQLRVEVLDAQTNTVITPFTKSNSIPVSDNKTLREMRWQGVTDLSSLAGRPIKFRFYLTNGRLYSFWVTSSATGASNGYVGAGGPGFTGPTDTIGGSVAPPDLIPPTVSVVSPSANQTVSGALSLSATASDNVAVASVQFKIDGADAGPAITAPPYTRVVNTNAYPDGPHSVTALARDTAGNSQVSAPVEVTIKNDFAPPVVSGGAPTGALPAGTTQTSLTVNTNEAANCKYATAAGVAYAAMPGTFSTTGGQAHSTTISGLATGAAYNYYIRCQDVSGNTGTADFVVTFSIGADTQPPTISVTSPTVGQTVAGTITLTAAASDNVAVAGVRFSVDGGTVGQAVITPPYTFSLNTQTYSDGSHNVSAVAWDAAGNTQAAAAIPITIRNDMTPPIVSGGTPNGSLPFGTSQTPLSVTTNEPATCRYSTTAGVGYAAMTGAFTTTGKLLHLVTVSSLTNGASYSYFVRCQDASGNATSSDFVVAFTVGGDTVSPAVTITSPVNGQTVGGPVAITVSASDNVSVLGVRVTIDGVALGNELSAPPYIFSWNTVTLTDGNHVLTAIARDAAGNSRSSSITVLVNNIPRDTLAPGVSAGAPNGTLPSGATQTTISVSTSEVATCRYATSAGTAYASMSGVFTTTNGVAHSAVISGLTNGVFTYYVRCIDAAGNATTSDYAVALLSSPPSSRST
jgi:hypothetical protein